MAIQNKKINQQRLKHMTLPADAEFGCINSTSTGIVIHKVKTVCRQKSFRKRTIAHPNKTQSIPVLLTKLTVMTDVKQNRKHNFEQFLAISLPIYYHQVDRIKYFLLLSLLC